MTLWNSHYIRHSNHGVIPGRPDVLFYTQESFGEEIDVVKFNQVKTTIQTNLPEIEENQVKDYITYISNELGLSTPRTFNEAKINYFCTIDAIEY